MKKKIYQENKRKRMMKRNVKENKQFKLLQLK